MAVARILTRLLKIFWSLAEFISDAADHIRLNKTELLSE